MAESGHVVKLEHQGREITIVGTAHISQRSVEEVERVISELRPETVCVELDATRYEALVDPTSWRKLDLFSVIRNQRALFLVTSLALSAYQRRLGEKLGVRPGAELLAAIRQAEKLGARVVLCDRNIEATLKRTWRSISFWNKVRLSTGLVAAPLAVDEITEQRVEELKQRDTISEMLEELAKMIPGVREPLIDERDQYLMSMVREAPGHRVVAVVGAGHVAGMLRSLNHPVDREELTKIPPPSLLSIVLKWAIPMLVLGGFLWGFTHGTLVPMGRAWVLCTSVVCALFTLLAGARPLSILTAAVAAPVASLSPLVSVGTLTGLIEAWLRKPTASDRERVILDVLSLRGLYRNRATRVLLVTLAASIGGRLGAWIGAAWVVALLRH